MQFTTRLPRRSPPRPTASTPSTPEADEMRDARRGGGPEDHALYSCMCGYAFTAKVTTSVDCPLCGVEQAW
jgi:hypothetical protein